MRLIPPICRCEMPTRCSTLFALLLVCIGCSPEYTDMPIYAVYDSGHLTVSVPLCSGDAIWKISMSRGDNQLIRFSDEPETENHSRMFNLRVDLDEFEDDNKFGQYGDIHRYGSESSDGTIGVEIDTIGGYSASYYETKPIQGTMAWVGTVAPYGVPTQIDDGDQFAEWWCEISMTGGG